MHANASADNFFLAIEGHPSLILFATMGSNSILDA